MLFNHPPLKKLYIRYSLKYFRYSLNSGTLMSSSPKMGRPATGKTTTKCSFSLNTEVLEDLKATADAIGVTRSVFLSMLLAESLPLLKKTALKIKKSDEDPVEVAQRYSDQSKAVLDARIAQLRGSKDGRQAS